MTFAHEIGGTTLPPRGPLLNTAGLEPFAAKDVANGNSRNTGGDIQPSVYRRLDDTDDSRLGNNRTAVAPLRVLSLFAGIGGIDLGLERTGGFETVAFCEFDREARATLKARFPGKPIYDDVRELTGDRLRADGVFPNAIAGGFPCQDVSLAGRGEGLEGARSGLWAEYARLVCELRPEVILVENVAALLGRGIERVLGDLASLGYDAEWHCIPASYAGARQLRDRVWIVAYPQRNSVQGRQTVTAAWCSKPRAEQLAGLVQPCAWPTVSSARDRGTGHGVPRGIHRNKQLGNSVNPQVVELIGRAILEALNVPTPEHDSSGKPSNMDSLPTADPLSSFHGKGVSG